MVGRDMNKEMMETAVRNDEGLNKGVSPCKAEGTD